VRGAWCKVLDRKATDGDVTLDIELDRQPDGGK
jgi:hypothetical protein